MMTQGWGCPDAVWCCNLEGLQSDRITSVCSWNRFRGPARCKTAPKTLFKQVGAAGGAGAAKCPGLDSLFHTLPLLVCQLARGRFNYAAVRCTASEGDPVAVEALTCPAKAISLVLWPIRRLSQDRTSWSDASARWGNALVYAAPVPEGLP